MWKTLCVSATVGVGVSVAATVTDWHLFASNSFQSSPEITVENGKAEDDFRQASILFEQGHAEEALNQLQSHGEMFTYETPNGKKWVDLAVDVNTALLDDGQLMLLFRHFPEAFKGREKASLLVGNVLILQRDGKMYSHLRDSWKGQEELQIEWWLLDVDALLLSNRRTEAIKLLNSRSLTGDLEVNRLVRLALLNIQNDPKAAWEYLNKANAKDPDNIDVYTYRASLLESVGKKNLALAEYIAALEVAPKNIFLKDLLADFYLHNGQYQQAIGMWKESLDGTTLDTIWLKILFWSRMTTPSQEDWSGALPPAGKLYGFNLYLLELAPDQFWNQARFEKIHGAEHLLTTQQATFWLRLLNDLKNGQEESALKLLRENPFAKNSWNPSLERALRQLLVYRNTGSVDITGEDLLALNHKEDDREENAFFAFLDALAGQPELLSQEKKLKALLCSNEAFVVAFLSAGWLEAGLQLHRQAILPVDLPDWVAVAIAEAINSNRGYEEALKFAMMQAPSAPLSTLMSSLLKSAKNSNSLVFALKKMATKQSEQGMKAAWLLSLIYIERGNYNAAKQSIHAQPLLSEVLLGKETLARIALLEGDTELAGQIYLDIESHSSEAKSFLASQAFNQKNWKRAQVLTQQLLNIYPDNFLLQENLLKISQAAKLQSSPINFQE